MNQQAREIVKLEEAFWQTMVDDDPDKAMEMIADQCLITGPMGTMRSDPADYKRMAEQGDWELDRFEFSDVEVIVPVASRMMNGHRAVSPAKQRATVCGAPTVAIAPLIWIR